jgi:hypothetical protein
MEAIKQRASEIFNNKPRLVAWWDRVRQRKAVCKASKKNIVWQEARRQKARAEVKASKILWNSSKKCVGTSGGTIVENSLRKSLDCLMNGLMNSRRHGLWHRGSDGLSASLRKRLRKGATQIPLRYNSIPIPLRTNAILISVRTPPMVLGPRQA